MPVNWKEVLIESFMGPIKAIGQIEIGDLLEKLDVAEDDAEFAEDLKGGYRLFKRLQLLAEKTKTKIDDGLLDLVVAAIEMKAESAGIDL